MQHPWFISGVKSLGISLVGLGSLALAVAFFARSPIGNSELSTTHADLFQHSFLEGWWKPGQGKFTFFTPAPTADSLALDRLISWRARPGFLSPAEIEGLTKMFTASAGDYLFFAADKAMAAAACLGSIRKELIAGIKPAPSKPWSLHWMLRFPLLEWEPEEKRSIQ